MPPEFYRNMQTVLELLKYTIPALVVLIACYSMVRNFLATAVRRDQIAAMRETQDATLRLRLQAYERLVIYMERIHPRQLIPRIYNSEMTVAMLNQALVFNIRTEFEHNLSQQIYVSPQAWNMVRGTLEQVINLINQIGKQLPGDAPAKELYMRITDAVISADAAFPTDMALQLLNEEAKQMLIAA